MSRSILSKKALRAKRAIFTFFAYYCANKTEINFRPRVKMTKNDRNDKNDKIDKNKTEN